tara:strand:+ start:3734 stop:4492 length:759 start_codon:yes stop_codon:yes gene_type:complete
MKIEFLKQYKNKIVLITGVSGQIGNFTVKFFLKLGCIVYGIDIKKSKIKSKKFIFKQFDISDAQRLQNFINEIYKKYKRIDVVINNAAVSYKTNFKNRTGEELKETVDINLLSPINIIKIISKKHNSKLTCKIINIGSIYGVRSPDFNIYDNYNNMNSEIYGSSKAAIIQITKYFAVLLASKNIIINCISPGGLKNKNVQKNKFILNYSKKVPLRRMCKEDDLKMALLYFSNKETNYTTGQNLIIDGGFTLC